MSFQPNPQQTLLIFSMLLGETPEQREPPWGKCKPKVRNELVKRKFVAKTTRLKESNRLSKNSRVRKADYLTLTGEGKAWALQNLFCRLPERGVRPKQVLARLQDALMPLLLNQWAEVERRLFPGAQPSPDVPPDDDLTLQSIQRQIREAYLSITGGKVKERVLLKDLRSKVSAMPEDFDAAVLALQTEQVVVLMGLDNMAERTPEVEAAALHILGNPRHLLYFQG